MDYFIKFLWCGALLEPKCWWCAFKKNPCIVLFFFIIFSFFTTSFEVVVTLLLCGFFLLAMVLYMILPREHYRLNDGDRVMHFFLYEINSKWFVDDETYNRAFLRVFIKEGKKWSLLEAKQEIAGFDTTLTVNKCFLVKLPHFEWGVYKNGSFKRLGRKIADYVFVSASKNKEHEFFFFHNTEVLMQKAYSYEKLSVIYFDDTPIFKELFETRLAETAQVSATKRDGCFLLLKDKNCKDIRLFKTIMFKDYGKPMVFQVYTNKFSHLGERGRLLSYNEVIPGRYKKVFTCGCC